jgi:hypothetical protein
MPMTKRLPLHRLFAVLVLGAALASCAEPRQSLVEPAAPSELLGLDLGGLGLPLVPILTNTLDAVLTQVVGPAGGLLSLPGGSSLSIPAGALSASTTISATQEGGVLKIEFGPEGLVFPDSALPTLTFSYAGASVASAPVVVYLDSAGAVKEVLETEVDPVAQVARAKVRHFSTYALVTD